MMYTVISEEQFPSLALSIDGTFQKEKKNLNAIFGHAVGIMTNSYSQNGG